MMYNINHKPIYYEWTVLPILFRQILFQQMGCVFSLLLYFIEMSVFGANSVDPDPTPLFVAYDPSLHCFQMSFM